MEILSYEINEYYIDFLLGNFGVLSIASEKSDNYLVYGLYENYFSINKKGKVVFWSTSFIQI